MSSATCKNSHWFISVLSAIIWNLIVAILKFVWFFLSWSWAILSEAIHSVADTMNQIFLMIWINRSKKSADYNFDYWYWKERFFWAILSACWIFFIWSWATIYHWIEWLFHPISIEKSSYSYIYFILMASFIIESITLFIAIKSIYKKDIWLIDSIKNSDNASKAVILEDWVAVFWIVIAFVSILLTYYTWNIYIDSIWSIIIWILLWIVAIILILENRDYLLWKAIDEDLKEEIIEYIESNPLIEKVTEFKSIVLDIDSYIITVDAEFNWTSLMREINKNWYFKDEYDYIKDDYNDFLKFCVDYADRLPRIMGKEIDLIEKKIQLEYPSIKHIDIELN